ncbi:MAG TPA: hypothetical protein VNW46_03810, partial [Gemmatimonadaceae bacterium]|nr:hypothetical protein [Gemmatimonadaceae bacterium]
VTAAAILTIRSLRRGTTRDAVARTIEREQSLRRGAVRVALEAGTTGALGRRGARDLVARLGRSGSGRTIPATERRLRQRALLVGAVAAAGVGLCALITTRAPDGWGAVLHPIRAWRGTLLPRLTIDAPPDVVRGEPATVRVAAPGRRRVALATRTRGSEWTTTWYPVDGAGATRVRVGPVDADLALVADDGRATSDTLTVRVSERPYLGGLAMRAIYPDYLKRASEALPAGEVARVPRGTRIMINGRASTALDSVSLVHSGSATPLVIEGQRFSGRLDAAVSGRWEWHAARLGGGVITELPAPIELDVVPDSAPTVVIVSPDRDTIVSAIDRVVLTMAASDDHGLASVVLHSWRQPGAEGEARPPEVTQRVVGIAPAQWRGDVELDLGSRGLVPGDALHVVAVATDESPWAQTGSSRELILRVPSLTEQRTLARAAADSAASTAAQVAQAQRQLEQRTEDASRARGQRQTASSRGGTGSASSAGGQSSALSYESAERAKQLGEAQRQLAAKVQALQQQAKQIERQLAQAGSLDSGLARQLHEAQQLLRDALTPELQAQLDKLNESAQSLRQGDERQTLNDLAQQQQRVRDQLERSANVLKRAALEGAMQTLRDEARDLAHRDSAAANAPKGAQNAQALAAQSRQLSKAVDSLAKRLAKEKAETGAKQVGAATPHVDSSADAMQRAGAGVDSQQARQGQQQRQQPQVGQGQQQQQGQRGQQQQPGQQGQQQPGEQGQQQLGQGQQQQQGQGQQQGQQPGQGPQQAASQAADQMGRAAQQLADARAAQVGEWKSAVTSELDRSIQESLQMARQENDLAQRAQQGADANSLKAEQSAIQQGAQQSADRLQRAGRQSALVSGGSQRALSEARSRVQDATNEVQQAQTNNPGGGGGQQAAGAMHDAADALNQAAASLVRDRERANAASSSSGLAEMLQQMQQLAQQQGALNAQSQGLSLSPSGAQSGGNTGAAQALAEAQRRLAQSLDAMGGNDGSGRADAMAREAHEIASSLARTGPDPATLARQQRLYHRLLDAGHTLEQDERDSSGKREAQSAVDRPGFVPGSSPVNGRSATRFHEPTWNELRGLSADERQLVLDYFRRINAATP